MLTVKEGEYVTFRTGSSLATIIGSLPWFRRIFIRERIQLVHGHSTFSSMAHEAMFHGWLMGIRTVFTDHSLFGFADASAILTNTLVLQYSLANVDRIICVSYTSKENTVLRGKLDPRKVFTIPNAIETKLFYPDIKQFYENPTTIIFLGRLVYRKGADLLCAVIPKVCTRYTARSMVVFKVCTQHPQVRFIIGGDGPKRLELEEMREQHRLHDRVTLIGTLPHDMVREVLVQGQIFINTSLTEAFCMSIVEAASCGLHVVSTRVGGIPEVLPAEFISLEEPVPDLLVGAISDAVRRRENSQLMNPIEKHEAVSMMYYWPSVCSNKPCLHRYANQGIGFGIIYIVVAMINMLFLAVLEFFDPSYGISMADDMPRLKSTKFSKSPAHNMPKDPECSMNHRLNCDMPFRNIAKTLPK
ncbi:glycosyltransferase, group 1 family protein [Dictyocaulus viviparus]|uniref:Glycosyltransferase, group 1 family protein n=1 Tax=Dictyocaulus viviparus TaxID=29172 RepID=A0A0D8XFM6_DICVI|nr:glycosyltransferase, group 1 family protein [Dictyocaulus viviparus]